MPQTSRMCRTAAPVLGDSIVRRMVSLPPQGYVGRDITVLRGPSTKSHLPPFVLLVTSVPRGYQGLFHVEITVRYGFSSVFSWLCC